MEISAPLAVVLYSEKTKLLFIMYNSFAVLPPPNRLAATALKVEEKERRRR